jgi:hypothetical protein
MVCLLCLSPHFGLGHGQWKVLPTKYVYIKSTTVYVLSSELGSPTPWCAPPPWNQRGRGHTRLRVRGGAVPIPTTGEKA